MLGRGGWARELVPALPPPNKVPWLLWRLLWWFVRDACWLFCVSVLLVVGGYVVLGLLFSPRESCEYLDTVRAHHEFLPVPKLRIAIVVLSDSNPDHATMTRLSLRNKRAFAEMHGYDLVDGSGMVDETRPAAWSKLLALMRYLPQYDVVVWMDIDTVIMEPEIKLEWLMLEEGMVDPGTGAFTSDVDVIATEDLNGPNTGIMLLRNTAWTRDFLQLWWDQDQFVSGKFLFEYEQRGFHFLLNTDRWRKAGMPLYDGDFETNRRHVRFVPQCSLNSYEMVGERRMIRCFAHGCYTKERFASGDFMVHFAGYKGVEKLDLFLQYYVQSIRPGVLEVHLAEEGLL